MTAIEEWNTLQFRASLPRNIDNERDLDTGIEPLAPWKIDRWELEWSAEGYDDML